MNKVRVLVVNDDKRILENSRSYLEGCGYKVLTAEEGKSALEVVGKEKLDVILTDVQMPGMGGLELVKNLRGNGFKGDIGFSAFTKVDEGFLRDNNVFGQYTDVIDAIEDYEKIRSRKA